MMRRRYNRKWNAARVGGASLDQLQELLAALRASYLLYRTAHWQASGDAAYGDHLLLQRIYEETDKHVDQVGERTVGYFGEGAVDLMDQSGRVAEWSAEFSKDPDTLQASLAAAKRVRSLLEQTYQILKKDSQMTLGLDDLIMALASAKDEHIYLLQQATRGRTRLAARAANYGGIPFEDVAAYYRDRPDLLAGRSPEEMAVQITKRGLLP